MNSFLPDIKSIMDIEEWEKVQDQLAILTGTAIITVDYKGIPVSKHSGRTDFCTVIRENSVSRKRCYKCDALASLEAVRRGEPFIYLCHCGIVDVAVPVTIGDRYFGAVMFGEVRIVNNGDNIMIKRLVNEISTFKDEDQNEREYLLEMYNRLPIMEYGKIVETANLINSFVKYVVNRSLKRFYADNTDKIISNSGLMPPEFDGGIDGDDLLDSLQTLDAPPKKYSYQNQNENLDISMGSPVYPAILYIYQHRDKMPGMQAMASLCHLSPSYFSRVFQKETGENYSSYLNRTKIKWAKALLSGTDSIAKIAFLLGYQDSSYFVKVFKKFEGITPKEFRSSQKRK